MKITAVGLFLLISLGAFLTVQAQEVPPLVYSVENTGDTCPAPVLPTFEELSVVIPLTDPFEWSDGSGRDTTFKNWEHRRNEIFDEVQNYEVGPKPGRPDTIEAFLYGDSLLVISIIENGDTLTLNSTLTIPEGEGPFPVFIGIGYGAGSLPVSVFTERDIALASFNYSEVMAHQQSRGNEPINKLYPDLSYMGAYAAWPWGVSRLIDGLEMISDSLNLDLQHLGISGCSFAGKMAMYAGAMDERIALTVIQESGGGGVAAWRLMETLDGVEKLSATDDLWFMQSMWQFANKNVSKLPHDHHETLAMIAPRAVLVLGNPDMVWLGEEAGYTSCEAAKKVWENFGIGDRFGFSFVAGHGHCALPAVQYPELEAFVDKFLLGDDLVDTDNIGIHPYNYVVPEFWTDWWGKGDPYFPVLDRGNATEVWYETECATVGAAWNVRLDELASNGSYAVVKDGFTNTKAPTDSGAAIYFDVNIPKDTTYYIYGRMNCPTYDNDAIWIKIDGGNYVYTFGLLTEGWEWKKFAAVDLTAGQHTIAVAYRETNVKFDKLSITSFFYPPGEKGEEAEYICEPDTTTVPYNILALDDFTESGSYSLNQNYPNPMDDMTTLTFEIPQSTFVSLKVYSLLGEEVAELAGKEYPAGIHAVEFNGSHLAKGIYFYTLKADDFSATRKMVLRVN